MATLSFNADLPPKNDKAHALQVHPVRRKSTEYLDDIAVLSSEPAKYWRQDREVPQRSSMHRGSPARAMKLRAWTSMPLRYTNSRLTFRD